MSATTDPQSAPTAPRSSLSRWQQYLALRHYHVGPERVRDADGPVVLISLGPTRFVPRFALITSPEGARDVLGGTDSAIDKFSMTYVQGRLYGENVFNMPYRRWLPRRRALQPLFTKRNVATYARFIAAAAEEVAVRWARNAVVDVDRDCRELALQVIGRSVFGLDLGPRAAQLERDIKLTQRYISRRTSNPLRLPIWLPTPARHAFRRSLAAIRAVVDEAVALANSDPDRDAPLIRLLLETVDSDTGQQLDADAIRNELVVFLVAGHDTTATTLAYALWQLGRNTDMQSRVAAEAAAIGDRTLRVADVPALPYTVQVVHEALRLCPPGPAAGRMAMTDIVVDGRRVPKGTDLLVSIYALHRDPALWQQPTRFDPDRFTKEKMKALNRWQYLPFGGGPRSCIGDHFAMLEAALALATLVRAIAIESERDDFPFALPFTMTAAGPVPVRVRPRGRPTSAAVAPIDG